MRGAGRDHASRARGSAASRAGQMTCVVSWVCIACRPGFLLSVVIPVYNKAQTIERVIARVRATELPHGDHSGG